MSASALSAFTLVALVAVLTRRWLDRVTALVLIGIGVSVAVETG